MRKYFEEIFIPGPLKDVFISSNRLSLLGTTDYGAETLSFYRGDTFFIMLVDHHYQEEFSISFWYEDEIEDLKDTLIEKLQECVDDIIYENAEDVDVQQSLKHVLGEVNRHDLATPPRQISDGVELLNEVI